MLVGDGSVGVPAQAPFDAIAVAAAVPEVPPSLLGQLTERGRLVLPLGGRRGQRLTLIRRVGDGFSSRRLVDVRFVPLRGVEGVR